MNCLVVENYVFSEETVFRRNLFNFSSHRSVAPLFIIVKMCYMINRIHHNILAALYELFWLLKITSLVRKQFSGGIYLIFLQVIGRLLHYLLSQKYVVRQKGIHYNILVAFYVLFLVVEIYVFSVETFSGVIYLICSRGLKHDDRLFLKHCAVEYSEINSASSPTSQQFSNMLCI